MAVEVGVTDIGSGYNRTTINDNFQNIDTGLQDALSRSGVGPNEMEADLDLNSNDLLNVGTVSTERLIVDGDEFFADEAVAKGDPGDPATVEVGTVTTGAAGSSVIITNTGTTQNAVFNFTIPRGDTGASGAGTGDMLAAQNLNDVANKPTAFANIKQAASDTATGVVELATDAETQTGTDTTRAITPANLTAKEATVTHVRSNTADRILTTDIVNSAMAEVTLTDATTIAWNMQSGFDFTVTLAGNRTLGNPTNTIVGRRGRIRVVQDATGGRTLTKSSNHKTAGGAALTLSTTAGAVDYIDYDCRSSTDIRLTVSRNWS